MFQDRRWALIQYRKYWLMCQGNFVFFFPDLPPCTVFKNQLFFACDKASLKLQAQKFSLLGKCHAFAHVRNLFEKIQGSGLLSEKQYLWLIE